MSEYTFDLSYYSDNVVEQEEYDAFLQEFGNSFHWYCSELDFSPHDPAKRSYRNNGYNTKDLDALKRLCEKVKTHDKFFLDFVGRCIPDDCIWFYAKHEDEKVDISLLNDHEKLLRSILKS